MPPKCRVKPDLQFCHQYSVWNQLPLCDQVSHIMYIVAAETRLWTYWTFLLNQGLVSMQRCCLSSIEIPIIDIRKSYNSLLIIHIYRETDLKIEIGLNPYLSVLLQWHWGTLNTLRPRQNGSHFADDIWKCISLNENYWTVNKISLNYVP